MSKAETISEDDAKGLIRAFAEAPTTALPMSAPSPPEDPACRERYDALMRRIASTKDSKQ